MAPNSKNCLVEGLQLLPDALLGHVGVPVQLGLVQAPHLGLLVDGAHQAGQALASLEGPLPTWGPGFFFPNTSVQDSSQVFTSKVTVACSSEFRSFYALFCQRT